MTSNVPSNVVTIDGPARKPGQSLTSWLAKVKVQAGEGNIITEFATSTVWTVLQTLLTSNILSVPIYDEQAETYIGVVDMLDIFNFVLLEVDKEDLLGLERATSATVSVDAIPSLKKPIRAILNISRRNPYLPIMSGAPLTMVFAMLGAQGLHRACITLQNPNDIKGVVSQSHLIKWIGANTASFADVLGTTVEQAGCAGTAVHSCDKDSKLVDALKLLALKRVSALAVVDSAGKLVGQLTVRDIRTMIDPTKRAVNWGVLFGTVEEVLRLPADVSSISAAPTDTLLAVVQKLASHEGHTHRLFCVDASGVCQGVVSLRDVVRAVGSH